MAEVQAKTSRIAAFSRIVSTFYDDVTSAESELCLAVLRAAFTDCGAERGDWLVMRAAFSFRIGGVLV